MSYQPPQNNDQNSPWSGGDGAGGSSPVRDGGPQGPAHDASSEAPRYGVRTSEQGQPGQDPQGGAYGQSVGFGPGSQGQDQGGYQAPAQYVPAHGGGNGNQNPYGQGQGGYQPVKQGKDGRGMGIAGMVLGIISVVLFFLGLPLILAIVGLILSIIAVVRASRARAGKGFGIAGIILNILGLILNGIMVLVMIAFGGMAISMFNDPEIRPCIDTYMSTEGTSQDQADFEQCIDDALEQQDSTVS